MQPKSKLDKLSRKLLLPFTHGKSETTRILTDLAPVIMTPRLINAAGTSRQSRQAITSSSYNPSAFVTLTRRLASNPTDPLTTAAALDLNLPIPETEGVPLLRGYQATNPLAGKSRLRRREVRATLVDGDMSMSITSDGTPKRRPRESLGVRSRKLPQEELTRQTNEIVKDKENIEVRRGVLTSEIQQVTRQIQKLEEVKRKLESDLLKLTEEELELDDELEGVLTTLSYSSTRPNTASRPSYTATTQQRRKGPAFLPSEHDDLPPGVAFMTLPHPYPVLDLDFSAPYELLVSSSSSSEGCGLHVWDLTTGSQVKFLVGHNGPVKALQVEESVCISASEDTTIRIWDLAQANEWEEIGSHDEYSVVDEGERPLSGTSQANGGEGDACVRVLEGHSRGVTALYFENECLVSGASDKTVRQWDLNTGQCVLTMDILWAMSNSVRSPRRSYSMAGDAETLDFSQKYENYEDFVGAVQFWGYALVSGSADGAVRMWDMRTGQSHRTLKGHTGPVTCLQFDEHHVVSGSLDKSIRIWDLRTSGTIDSLTYEGPVTSLQFDSRKIISCCGENGIKIYNRTSQHNSTLTTNGHTAPAVSLRYIDRYLVSGGRDSTVKVWAL
ncbi:WD40 repeat-like protein [Sistotremastrum suecicum HHB10207 ss-3]|uniref:WD40 repeat-like protein n=1 Tax=Sistotremastrum suecicum HHB10207 ss-3 TaxID=1314776 RepID=A0A165X8E1_9AGAM|nr:WD40 repeat-like protein [Sistotremastrum suecicum HHB10207 ss-3]